MRLIASRNEGFESCPANSISACLLRCSRPLLPRYVAALACRSARQADLPQLGGPLFNRRTRPVFNRHPGQWHDANAATRNDPAGPRRGSSVFDQLSIHDRRSPMSWNPYENLPPAASFSLTSSDLREGEKLAMPQVSGIFAPAARTFPRSSPGTASRRGRRASWSLCATPKRPRSAASGTGPW